MKRILSFFLAAILICACIPATAVQAAESGFTAYCEFCQKEATWTQLATTTQTMSSGHYFLANNMTITAQNIKSGATLCLYLNGKKLTANKVFNVNGTANIQGPGRLVSRGIKGSETGAFHVKKGGVLNALNTTFTFENIDNRTGYLQNGGIMYVAGTANLEGCTLSDGIANVAGGNIYVAATGNLNLKDSIINSATAPTANCIYSAGSVRLSGSTRADNILLGSAATGQELRIDSSFTGRAGISLPAGITDNTDIGDVTEGSSVSGAITVANMEMDITVSGTDLIVKTPPAATILDTAYGTVEAALAAAKPGDTVVLHKSTGDITVSTEITLDLNGCNIRSLTAAEPAVVFVLDSKTKDYDITDGDYGKIGTIHGNVRGVENQHVFYLPTTESDGTSYHALHMEISSMTLRGSESALYFTSHFEGDEKIAAMVECFGVAMRVSEAPNAESMVADGNYTVFSADLFNADSASTSSMVTGILKKSSSQQINQRNAAIQIYGRPYIQFTDGSMLMGSSRNRSLREHLESINNKAADLSWLDDTQKQQLFSLYQKYPEMFGQWSTDTIRKEWLDHEEKTFKVLAITSSFGLNTTQFFREIAIAEGMENATIARAYASGCTLEKHVKNMEDGTGIYDYSKNSTGKWSTRYETSLEYALEDDYWDVIFIQQSAAKSPILSSYQDYIDQLMAYVVPRATNPNVKYVWNMTWAYQGDSTQTVFVQTFGKDQMAMYNSILNCVQEKVVPRTDFCAIIPSGTAIQNARTSYFGDTLTKDTYHLNNLGRVIAGYTMYATLTGKPLTEVNIGPINSSDVTAMLYLNDADRQVIIECVNNALENPWEVTPSTYPTAP